MNERLALLEAENQGIRTAVSDIRDAVVQISAALTEVARLEERFVNLAEASSELRRSLEAERENRANGDKELEQRIRELEKPVGINTDKLATAGAWTMRMGSGLILLLAGLFAGKFIGG